MRYNRKLLMNTLESGGDIRVVQERGVGKTTQAILVAIANAIDRPYAWHAVFDPDALDVDRKKALLNRTKGIVDALELEGFKVAMYDRNVAVRSEFAVVM